MTPLAVEAGHGRTVLDSGPDDRPSKASAAALGKRLVRSTSAPIAELSAQGSRRSASEQHRRPGGHSRRRRARSRPDRRGRDPSRLSPLSAREPLEKRRCPRVCSRPAQTLAALEDLAAQLGLITAIWRSVRPSKRASSSASKSRAPGACSARDHTGIAEATPEAAPRRTRASQPACTVIRARLIRRSAGWPHAVELHASFDAVSIYGRGCVRDDFVFSVLRAPIWALAARWWRR